MATPTGQISYTDVKNELGVSGEIRISYENVRKLAGKPSGQIAFSDLRGKSNATWVHITNVYALGSGHSSPNVTKDRAVDRLHNEVLIAYANNSWNCPNATDFGVGTWGYHTNGLFKYMVYDYKCYKGPNSSSYKTEIWAHLYQFK